MREIDELIKSWRFSADFAEARAAKIWEELKTGVLPQEDQIIYSVYELQEKAAILRSCAADLEKTIGNHLKSRKIFTILEE